MQIEMNIQDDGNNKPPLRGGLEGFLLGYDLGSSSVKASLVNAATGECVSSAFFPKKEMEIKSVKAGWRSIVPKPGGKT